MNSKTFVIINALIAIVLCINACQARHQKSGKKSDMQTRVCQGEECSLRAEHFVLYSTVKGALESQFDIRGKEMYPFLNSVELLKLRYDGNDAALIANNGSRLVRELLVSNELRRVMKIIQSPSGRSLADLYRTPTNGNEQNLACNKLRIDDIERASRMLDSDKELKNVFGNIHKNFVRKSAKKCLKKACSGIDDSMTRLDSMLNKRSSLHHRHHDHNRQSSYDDASDRIPRLSNQSSSSSEYGYYPSELDGREFSRQELALCNFFKKTNQSDCTISGSELSEINLIKGTQLNDLLAQYATNNNNIRTISPTQAESTTATPSNPPASVKSISELCEPMRAIMDHNLAAFKWYNKNELFTKQKYSSRTSSCPKLSYWLQLDRLCGEIDCVSKNGISPIERESTITY